MDNKVINFNESKTRLINKRYPNITKMMEKAERPAYLESNKALDNFQSIYFKYKEYLAGTEGAKEVTLNEVLVYFNRYFDEIYKYIVNFEDEKVVKLKEMMDYAMLSNGKRLRPFLMFLSYVFSYGEDIMVLAPFMVAIELIHTFSLIHDDLPCMDNDELRRGKETVWKKYGEDMGVLTGDALMMHASSILVEMILDFGYTVVGTQVVTSALILLRLAGLDGMISGQVFDVMNTQNKNLTIDDIVYMYDKKTTALLTAALMIGANMSGGFGDRIALIEQLSMNIGEAYQIKDDLLEIESTKEKIGKSTDSDKDNGKVTYVTLVGIKKAKERIDELEKESMIIIDSLTSDKNNKDANVFKEVVRYLMSRDR